MVQTRTSLLCVMSYIPSNPCKRCGTRKRFINGQCVQCKKVHNQKDYILHQVKRITSTRAWQKANPKHLLAIVSKRRASKLQRTPAWADKVKIRSIYEKCPKGFHVDHVIPLQHPLVSGLHVETNLSYLTASANCSKHNKFTSVTIYA